jgi:hypothetical protein
MFTDKQYEKWVLQQELSTYPIVVERCNEKIDHRALLEGLKGRINVKNQEGVAYVEISGKFIIISQLRRWLQKALLDPVTGKRYPLKDWWQDKWISLKIVELTQYHRFDPDKFTFTLEEGGLKVTTTFKNQHNRLGLEIKNSQDPVVHKVQFREVAEV